MEQNYKRAEQLHDLSFEQYSSQPRKVTKSICKYILKYEQEGLCSTYSVLQIKKKKGLHEIIIIEET